MRSLNHKQQPYNALFFRSKDLGSHCLCQQNEFWRHLRLCIQLFTTRSLKHTYSRWLFVAIFAFYQCHIMVNVFLLMTLPLWWLKHLYFFCFDFNNFARRKVKVELNTCTVCFMTMTRLKNVPGKCAIVKGTLQSNVFDEQHSRFVCVCVCR